uniref:GH18 domain-containing protein n=1 Tax=Varanus komodoensis TaxID=61221 RepID=A0A8D2KZV3_VARKO
ISLRKWSYYLHHLLLFPPDSAYKLACYFTNWEQYRPQPATFTPANVDPSLCTHLIYAFADLKDNQLTTKEPNDEILYRQLNDLKDRNNALLTLLAVGGGIFENTKFTIMVSSPENRRKFIRTTKHFLRLHKFDGLELDWEYPGFRGRAPEEKHQFTILIQVRNGKYIDFHQRRPRLLLSAAVSSNKYIVDAGYEIAELGKSLDLINVMTYDFHGSWAPVTGHNSPLHKGLETYDPVPFYNCEYAMKYWKDNGAPAEKLLMGFPTYGRTFRLTSSNTGVGAPASGGGTPGNYTKTSGVLAYYEVCGFLQGATKEWIEEQEVPYAFKDEDWVGYDDEKSFQLKVQFLKREKYGGAMIWTLGMDDFSGMFCGEGAYVLVNKLKDILENGDNNEDD